MSVGALIASDARADATVCDSTISGQNNTLGNVVVPKDAICTLNNLTVNGNIDQQPDSQLFLRFNVMVNGNISSHGAAMTVFNSGRGPIPVTGNVEIDSSGQVLICGAHISGNLAITNTNPGPLVFGNGCEPDNKVDGNVKIANNNVIGLVIDDNRIGKNMTITDNSTPLNGLAALVGNIVAGTLTCLRNVQPFGPGTNIASKIVGQCPQ
jgi:hypothetical protein